MTLATVLALVVGAETFPTLLVLAVVVLFVGAGLMNIRKPR
jgi:hypothetical protein